MSLAVSNRDGGKTSERGIYDALGAHLSGEIISGFRVLPADPVSMNVRIGGEYDSATGVGRDSALIRDGLRTYDVFIDDGVAVTATVSAAHASLARIDTVVLYIDKGVARTKTLVDNTNGVVKVKVVAGTPNASPVAPDSAAIQTSVGAGNPFARLSNINVAANTPNILAANITDRRNIVTVSNVKDIASDFVVSGTGVVAVSSGLTCTISDITYYISGIRYTKTGIPNKTFTASKDTYCFVDPAGTITYTEVAVDAAAPANPANTNLYAVVRTDATGVTRIRLANRGAIEGTQIDWSSRQFGMVSKGRVWASNVGQGATGGAGLNAYPTFSAYLIAGYTYKVTVTIQGIGSDRTDQQDIALFVSPNSDGSGQNIAARSHYLNGTNAYRGVGTVLTGYYDATTTGYKTFYNRLGTNPGSGYTVYINGDCSHMVECVGKTEWID